MRIIIDADDQAPPSVMVTRVTLTDPADLQAAVTQTLRDLVHSYDTAPGVVVTHEDGGWSARVEVLP